MRCLQKANSLKRKIGEDPLCLIICGTYFVNLPGCKGCMEYVWEEDTRELQGEWGVYCFVQDMRNKLDDEDVQLMARKLWLRQNLYS
jgi:hypothetical protein